MSKKAEVLVSYDKGEFMARIMGRATFDCSSGLLDMIKSLEPDELESATLDMTDCTGMDSTFMGIISKLAITCKRAGITAVIQNASDFNQGLLAGLGIKKLFDFVEKTQKTDTVPVPKLMVDLASAKVDNQTHAETVLDAHETLMEIDPSNVNKFAGVVEMVKSDMKKTDDTPTE